MIIKEVAIRAKNSAAISGAGRRNVKNMSLAMYTDPDDAAWALQWALAEASYPAAHINLAVGRKAFELLPGDVFRLTYTPLGISDMVVRVISIEEESIDSERINLTVVEDIHYVATTPGVGVVTGQAASTIGTYELVPLGSATVREPPFIYKETPNTIVPILSRETGTETGALVYASVDGGASYTRIGVTRTFSVHGNLATGLSAVGDTFDADIDVDSSRLSTNVNAHTELRNLILIDDEIISFTNITPVDDDTFTLSGLLRGVHGTTAAEHAIGADMYSVDGLAQFSSPMLVAGNTYLFKFVPFNSVNSGDISDAAPVSITFANQSMLPLAPANLTANGTASGATYTTDIDLAWEPRVRGSSDTPDDLIACEGRFEVRVIFGATTLRTVRTTTADPFFDAWSYSAAMNLADNTYPAGMLLFEVYDFIDSARYSPAASIVVHFSVTPTGVIAGTPVLGTPTGSSA